MPKPGFGDGPKYWDARYRSQPAPYDWLQEYGHLREVLEKHLKGNKATKIVHLGCGNSLLPEHLYDAGYKHITNVDNSVVVIEQMRERNKVKRPELQWEAQDALSLSLKDGQFDVAIDKSVIDTFACGDNAEQVIAKYLSEVIRVLKPNGVFVSINFGTPDTRECHLISPKLNWKLETNMVPVSYGDDSSNHYVYVCTKEPGAAIIGQRHTGVVQQFDRRRGFGFIKPDDGQELVFVHWKQIVSIDKWPALDEGMEVEYSVCNDKQSRACAQKVTFAGGGCVISFAHVVGEASLETFSGQIVRFNRRSGYGLIRIETDILLPEAAIAGSFLYFSREDVAAVIGSTQDSQKHLRVGQIVNFKARRREASDATEFDAMEDLDVSTTTAATEVEVSEQSASQSFLAVSGVKKPIIKR